MNASVCLYVYEQGNCESIYAVSICVGMCVDLGMCPRVCEQEDCVSTYDMCACVSEWGGCVYICACMWVDVCVYGDWENLTVPNNVPVLM